MKALRFFVYLGYIDPGSGFTFFNFGALILAAIAGAFGFMLLQFKRVIGFFKKIFGKKK
ncbi:MAG: hypothetical protein NC828_05120 [Candidatus Omnitrophica bacterium]|nr:hypothetical protein [Candidatus Omnitrophota bacterium]